MRNKKILFGIIVAIIVVIGTITMIWRFNSRDTLEAIIEEIDCDREIEYENEEDEEEYTVICKYTAKAKITDGKYKDKVVTVKFQNTEYHDKYSSVTGIYRDWQSRLEEGNKIYIYKRFGVWKLDGEKTEAHMFGWDEE